MPDPEVYTLWGGMLSVYTAKIRSYLIKKRIAYREFNPSHPDFAARILPAVGFFVIPVLETPDGMIVQDTSDIIALLEERFPEPCFVPRTPVQSTVDKLLMAFGSEGLNQPSMHYRWSFLDEHGDYIRAEFGRASCAVPDRAVRRAAADPSIGFMSSYLPGMGIVPATIPGIEESYLELLDILDEHFLYHPYLLGGRPAMADFGFMAGLFAHLSRDPVPSRLMKMRAPNVYRWTERMHLAQIVDGEFADHPEAYLPGDAIPATIEPLLAYIFQDWGAELTAATAHYNAWIAANPEMPEGTTPSLSNETKVHVSLGPIEYPFRGATMRRSCAPHTLWHFHAASTFARALDAGDSARLASLVERTGGERVMALQLARGMHRAANVLALDAGASI